MVIDGLDNKIAQVKPQGGASVGTGQNVGGQVESRQGGAGAANNLKMGKAPQNGGTTRRRKQVHLDKEGAAAKMHPDKAKKNSRR